VSADDIGLMSYDPGLQNTAACKSTISYIDGDKGILRYRGYPIGSSPREHLPRNRLPYHQGELPNQEH